MQGYGNNAYLCIALDEVTSSAGTQLVSASTGKCKQAFIIKRN